MYFNITPPHPFKPIFPNGLLTSGYMTHNTAMFFLFILCVNMTGMEEREETSNDLFDIAIL
jgi:hypothetical protein